MGIDRAVSASREVVATEELEAVDNRLRVSFLSGATRQALKEDPGLLDGLRARVSQ